MADGPAVRSKPQSRACEACRAAKVKCLIGPESVICKRCSEFKRECVFRTGPRTRRPKVAIGCTPLPPPPGPSQTFSIEFQMPIEDEIGSNLDELRSKHEQFISELGPSSDEEYSVDIPSELATDQTPSFNFSDLSVPMSAPTSATTMTATSGSPATRSMGDLGIKPQFNLDSAESLLSTFRTMLPHVPCVVLQPGSDVRSLAKERPFVLLAILAVTSCITHLQGHSLYDEEFRKVLGIKFVTGSERSLELLQGLLVYCAWFPFHLRPKSRHAQQYLRMALDIVQEMELDNEDTFAANFTMGLLNDDLDKIRAYISAFYLGSGFATTWAKPSSLPYSPWISTCCDILEQHSNLEQDQLLLWLVRLQHTVDELVKLRKLSPKDHSGSPHHRDLLRIGLETQFREWQTRMPTNVAMAPSVLMFTLLVDMFFTAGPLMAPSRSAFAKESLRELDLTKLVSATATLRAFFDHFLTIDAKTISGFSGNDWGHLIISIILSYRISLPIPECPAFDSAQTRRVLDFGGFLAKLSEEPADERGGPAAADAGNTAGRAKRDVNTLKAFRIILRVLKTKYDKKAAAADARAAALLAQKEVEEEKRRNGCPMLDGSLDDYIAAWDGSTALAPHPLTMTTGSYSYATSQTGTSSGGAVTDANGFPVGATEGADKTLVYHDLWATMTMGWADEDIDVLELGIPKST